MSDCMVKLIPPVTITDANLLASNVPETEYPIYNAGTTYANGAIVIAAHRIYQNNSDGNLTGIYPPDNLTQWADLEMPSNRWAMFDLYSSTITENPDSIVVDIKTGVAVNSLALVNISGAYVDVTATHPINGVIFTKRYYLYRSDGVRGWYSYFFTKRSPKDKLTELNIPAFRNVTMRIEIHAPGGTAKCGSLLIGRYINLGQLSWGYASELNDYSTKTIDANGYVSIKQGTYSFRPEFTMYVNDGDLDSVVRILARYRATPCIWIPGTRHEFMTAFGFFISFRPVVNHGLFSECSLQIEGFI